MRAYLSWILVADAVPEGMLAGKAPPAEGVPREKGAAGAVIRPVAIGVPTPAARK